MKPEGWAGSLDPERAIAVRSAIRRVESSVARFSRNDAPDIVQEALVRAVRHGVECDAEPWLKTVARRIAIDRARAAREVVALSEIEDASTSSIHGDPEAVFLANETLDLVRKALLSMPARYRDALLAYVEDQETGAVARRFGISSSATWTLLCRARARLRKDLDRVGYEAGFFAFRFQRWSEEAATAVATVGVAVGVALSPVPASTPDVPPQPRTTATVAVPAHSPTPVVTSKPKVVASAVETTPSVLAKPSPVESKDERRVARYELHSCAPLLTIGVKVEVVEEQQSLIGGLIKTLPEPLRVIDQPDC